MRMRRLINTKQVASDTYAGVRACVRVDFPSGDHISSIIQCQFVFMNIHKVFKGGASKREKRNRRSEVCIYRER